MTDLEKYLDELFATVEWKFKFEHPYYFYAFNRKELIFVVVLYPWGIIAVFRWYIIETILEKGYHLNEEDIRKQVNRNLKDHFEIDCSINLAATNPADNMNFHLLEKSLQK